MKTLKLSKVLTDDEVKSLKGLYLTEEHIKHDIVDTDCDCWTDEGVLLFKFRKNVFSNRQRICLLEKERPRRNERVLNEIYG